MSGPPAADVRLLTAEEILAAPDGEGPSLGDVLDVLALDDEGLRRTAADALRDEETPASWRRRLLAELLDGLPELRRWTGPAPDYEFARRYRSLRRAGWSSAAAVKELSPNDDPHDRAVYRKRALAVARKKDLGRWLAAGWNAAGRAIDDRE